MDQSKSEQAPLRSEYSDEPEMAELIEYFVSELPNRARAIDDCLRKNQLDELRVLAHQLKGASGGYGFGQLGDAAAKLEQTIETEGGCESIQSTVDDLLSLCQRISN